MIGLFLFALLVLQDSSGAVSPGMAGAAEVEEALGEAELLGGNFRSAETDAAFDALCANPSTSIIGSSRPISAAELGLCSRRGTERLLEFPLGAEGLVLAAAGRRGEFGMDLQELFLAAAFLVPADDACTLVPNPYTQWSDINPTLPRRPIRLYGPPAGSRTRDIFVDRALAEGARQIDCLEELERRDPRAFERAIMPRTDHAWLDAGENDDAIAAALGYVHDAVGILDWQSFQRVEGLRALPLNGVVPDESTIGAGSYPLSRPLYLYARPEALNEPSVRRLLSVLEIDPASPQVRRYSTGEDTISTVESLQDGRRVRRYETPR